MGPRRGISDQHHIEVNILDTSMSAIGTKQTFERRQSMSAFGSKADMAIALRNVCVLPKSAHSAHADVC